MDFARPLFDAAEAFGVTKGELCASSGVVESSFGGGGERDARASYTEMSAIVALLDHCVHGWGGEKIVPAVLHFMPGPNDLGALGFLFLTAPTLGAVVSRMPSAFQLLTNSGTWRSEVDNKSCRLVWERPPISIGTCAANEMVLLHMAASMLSEAMGRPLTIDKVRVRHSALAGRYYLREMFNASVEFNAGEDSLEFSRDYLDLVPIRSHTGMFSFFGQEVVRATSSLAGRDTWLLQFRREMSSRLGHQELTAGLLAELMRLGPRTLHRRLSAVGTSFSFELERLRRERAASLVELSDRSMTNIAMDLGFADSAVFSRAFRRWFGNTPSAVRRRQG